MMIAFAGAIPKRRWLLHGGCGLGGVWWLFEVC